MAQPNGTTETITGVVEALNERGCKVGGRWYNTSQYRPVPLPTRGAHVILTVKGSWIEAVDVQDAYSEPQRPAQPSNARERTITRLSVLKSAAAFAASRPDAKSTDVPRVAEAWLAWVTRDSEAE